MSSADPTSAMSSVGSAAAVGAVVRRRRGAGVPLAGGWNSTLVAELAVAASSAGPASSVAAGAVVDFLAARLRVALLAGAGSADGASVPGWSAAASEVTLSGAAAVYLAARLRVVFLAAGAAGASV
jgi:hypothetical protein